MREYLAKGYRPFPVRVELRAGKRTKAPAITSWKHYQSDPPDLATIETWETKYPSPEYGIGIATGRGFAVIDLDCKDPLFDDRGALPMERLQTAFPWFDPLMLNTSVRTCGGGLHIYCRTDLPVQNAQNMLGGNKEAGDILVDLRGDGGFVVAPPSVLWDGTEQRGVYSWLDPDGLPDISSLPKFPDALHIRVKQQPTEKVLPGTSHSTFLATALSLMNKVRNVEDVKRQKKTFFLLLDQTRHPNGFLSDSAEAQSIWQTAEDKVRTERGFTWTTLAPASRKAEIAVALEDWPFTIEKAVRIGDQLELTVNVEGDTRTVVMDVEFWLSQAKFRAAFFGGANLVLPPIKPKAYESFIGSVKFERIQGNGADIDDDIMETLRRKVSQTTFMEDNGDLASTGYGMKGGTLYFRTNALAQEYSMKIWSKSTLILALRKMGFDTTSIPGIGEVWIWTPNTN